MATSIKIDDDLKDRVQHLAGLRQRSAHWIMQEAITRYVAARKPEKVLRKLCFNRHPLKGRDQPIDFTTKNIKSALTVLPIQNQIIACLDDSIPKALSFRKALRDQKRRRNPNMKLVELP